MNVQIPYEGFEDYYKILEVRYPSNQAEIKSAFLKHAYTERPDARLVEVAFEVLADPETKEHYDFYYEQYLNGEIYATCGVTGCGCAQPTVSGSSAVKRAILYGMTIVVLLALGLLWLGKGIL